MSLWFTLLPKIKAKRTIKMKKHNYIKKQQKFENTRDINLVNCDIYHIFTQEFLNNYLVIIGVNNVKSYYL